MRSETDVKLKLSSVFMMDSARSSLSEVNLETVYKGFGLIHRIFNTINKPFRPLLLFRS
jgi:hypothetical protein